jgi:hypothetical protein
VFEKGVLRRYFGLRVRRRQDTGEKFVMRSFRFYASVKMA